MEQKLFNEFYIRTLKNIMFEYEKFAGDKLSNMKIRRVGPTNHQMKNISSMLVNEFIKYTEEALK